jgi:hypothetical protein
VSRAPAATRTTGTRAGAAPGKPTGFTRAGSYTYDLSGTASQPFGGAQNVSGTQSYVVDPPRGSSQHARSSGQNGSQDMTLTVRSTGLYVEDVHISQQGFDEDFKPVGTALYFPADYRTGSHWSWTAKSTDGKYTIDVVTKVSGSGSQTVGGKPQKALIVDSTLHITGAGIDLTSQQRDWVSTTYALILKEHSTSKGTAYGAKLSSDITRTLRSTDPS